MAICRPSSDRPSYGGLASDSRRDFRPVNVRFGSKASTQQLRPRSALPPKADKERKSWYVRFVPNVWPGRAVQDGLPRSTNVRAASMYQASEVEQLLRAIMGIRAHPRLT